MKTINEFRLPLLVLFGSMIIVLFTSYGNKKAHPDLNELMVAAFLKQNNKGDFSQPEFKKYTFYFLQGATLKGTAITRDGFFSANDVAAAGFGYGYSEEGPAEMTPKFWISHGGYSADVPEVPASLRHFYDPTKDEGNRYLTDIADAKIMGSLQKYVLTNPHTDGVQWALGTPGDLSADVQSHQYTWERGKAWMQLALKETDKDKKDEYMAKAWRSLGETLHMIADNGCPPHVRNDAHPSPVWGNNTWFGDPDPYEEFIDIIRSEDPQIFVNFAKGSPNSDLKNSIEKMNKAVDIAHALAAFTNTNFVTNETISGKDKNGVSWRQRTHPGDEYKSPLLENMKYNADNYMYSFAAGINQCTDHYYFADLIPKICDPFVDIECVKSQAKALFPNIIEAGKKVIGLYIPKLSIEIKSLDKGLLKGEIKHKTDDEYTKEIKYSGEVLLIIKDKSNREKKKISLQAKDGIFEEDGFKLAKEDKAIAKIEFGGVTVESPEFMGVNDNIFGTYKGKYNVEVSESTLLKMHMSRLNPNLNAEARAAGEYDVRATVKNELEGIQWLKNGGKGELSILFTIYDAKKPAESFAPTTNRYFVRSGGNTVYLPYLLSQTTDPAMGKCTGSYTNSGFDVQVESENLTYQIKATFSGTYLNGSWTCSYSGSQLASGSFTTVKINDYSN